MLDHVDKAELLRTLQEHLESELNQLLRAQRATQEGATHEESRAENDKDTRALESTYLARGLSERVVQLQNGVAAAQAIKARVFTEDDPVALGALIAVEVNGQHAHYLLAPAGAGLRLDYSGLSIQILSPKSPAGQALIGKWVDEEFEYETPQGRRQGAILAIR